MYLQHIVLHQLVHWLPSSTFSSSIHCAIVGRNVGNMPREVGFQVGDEANNLSGIIFATRSNKTGQPQLPMPDDVCTILPPDGTSQVHIHKSKVQKCSVSSVCRVAGVSGVYSLLYY